MSRSHTIRVLSILSLVGMLALTSCSATPGSAPPTSSAGPDDGGAAWPTPDPPSGEVIGAGTVMDADGRVELCLGAVAESYPPQCSGVPLAGWSWDGIEGSESSGDVTWGAYAVTGTFDGETFTSTQPPMLLALYDPMMPEDPTGGTEGETPEARLLEIQEQLPDRLGDDGSRYLSSFPDRGYLWVDVLWDDGTVQDAADEEFGDSVVVVRSALRPVEG
ncbi:hypothetical protein [Microbacterium sp. NPDC058345]|uniref:hypothetical protein n=1 Tax=Microbacterium sp. NPDC058345 TaxID=3346455 RepID=UPI00364E5FCE